MKFRIMMVVFVVSAFVAFCFSGCSTVKGMGRDIQSLGQGMENASDNVRD